MNVGFYCHAGVAVDRDVTFAPGQFGSFVRELAAQAGSVTFYAHAVHRTASEDFELREPLVRTVDLGPRRSAIARTLRPGPALRRFTPGRHEVDVMLVRGPTPLLPYLVRASAPVPAAIFVQGDYRTSSAPSWMPAWRRHLVGTWKTVYAWQQDRVARDTMVLVNSPSLARSFGDRAKDVRQVISSLGTDDTLADAPVPWAVGTEPKGDLRLIYVGRVVEEKGLLELADAMAMLVGEGTEVRLDVVGEPDDAAFATQLDRRIRELGLAGRVRLLGYVPSGGRLFEHLRNADLFVLPSHHEGFPHALIEAMAAGLPVVATRVGGIPGLLSHERHIVLVEPHSPRALADGIDRVVRDQTLRALIAAEGRRWASQHTLEKTCAAVLTHLRELIATTSSQR